MRRRYSRVRRRHHRVAADLRSCDAALDYADRSAGDRSTTRSNRGRSLRDVLRPPLARPRRAADRLGARRGPHGHRQVRGTGSAQLCRGAGRHDLPRTAQLDREWADIEAVDFEEDEVADRPSGSRSLDRITKPRPASCGCRRSCSRIQRWCGLDLTRRQTSRSSRSTMPLRAKGLSARRLTCAVSRRSKCTAVSPTGSRRSAAERRR